MIAIKKLSGLAAAAVIALSGCDKDKKTNAPGLLSVYSITSAGLYPEGFDYDTKNNRFIIGSFNKGEVYVLNADGNNFARLISDPKFVAVAGIYTDEANNRIIVLSGDAGASEKSGANNATAGKVAYVGIYDLGSGALIKGIDLKPLTPNGGAFPNSIAVDKDGNIYITDSFSPIVYKVDKNYAATVFANDPLLGAAAGSIGSNGIVYHSDGYFIVANTTSGKLLKVNAANASVAEVSGISVASPDGLAWGPGNKLIAIENGLSDGKVHVYSSTNGWTSAVQTKEIAIGKNEFPTSAVSVPDGTATSVYVLNSWLGKLLGGDKTQATYSIMRVDTQ